MDRDMQTEVRNYSTVHQHTNPNLIQGKHTEAHQHVQTLLPQIKVNKPFAGRLKYFIQQWGKITNDGQILNIIRGWEIPFLETPTPKKPTGNLPRSQDETNIITLEVESMLEKGAIEIARPVEGETISPLFLKEKKDGSQRPILNLKNLNLFIPYHHFKMEGLKDVKDILQPDDWMIKIDLKDAYFTLPLHPNSRKYIRFQWQGKLYQFLCLCFGLGPAPRLFTKIMKVPMSILRRLNIRSIIFLDDLLIFGSTIGETIQARDTALYLLENLGFVINLKKSVLQPSQTMEYLGVIIDSTSMTMTLTAEKIQSLTTLGQQVLASGKLSIRKLGSLIGKLVATAPAITPCMLQVRHLQQLHIQNLRHHQNLERMITLDTYSRMELEWWTGNLTIIKGKPIKYNSPDLIIESDAATSGGWGASCRGINTGGQWTIKEKDLHINQLEMIAADLAIRTYTKLFPLAKQIHLKIDNKTALSYIVKMGGTKNRELILRSKSLWEYLLSNGITLTAEYLPSKLNYIADHQSRNVKDWSEWKLCPKTFKNICHKLGTPEMDLFASRTSHQLTSYMSLKADPNCRAVDALQQNWSRLFPYAFPPFSLIGRVLRKALRERVTMIIITPIWVTQPWYPTLLQMSIQHPIILPKHRELLTDPRGDHHPLMVNQTLQLGAWLISGSKWKVTAFQEKLPTLSPKVDLQALDIITTQPGRNLVAGAVNDKLIQFNALQTA